MLRLGLYILAAGLAIGAPAASAGDLMPDAADGVMNACRPDYHRMCSYVVPGDGRAARCLLDHELDLSPMCLKAIKLASAVEACMPDYGRYCQGVPRGKQAFECLAGRMDMLLPECQRVVSANAPYMVPRGERYSGNEGYGPYAGPNPRGYAGREAAPGEDRYAGENEPEDRPYSGYAYRPSPRYEDPGASEDAPSYRPYDDRYAGNGYSERHYDNNGPREPYESQEEREEPAR